MRNLKTFPPGEYPKELMEMGEQILADIKEVRTNVSEASDPVKVFKKRAGSWTLSGALNDGSLYAHDFVCCHDIFSEYLGPKKFAKYLSKAVLAKQMAASHFMNLIIIISTELPHEDLFVITKQLLTKYSMCYQDFIDSFEEYCFLFDSNELKQLLIGTALLNSPEESEFLLLQYETLSKHLDEDDYDAVMKYALNHFKIYFMSWPTRIPEILRNTDDYSKVIPEEWPQVSSDFTERMITILDGDFSSLSTTLAKIFIEDVDKLKEVLDKDVYDKCLINAESHTVTSFKENQSIEPKFWFKLTHSARLRIINHADRSRVFSELLTFLPSIFNQVPFEEWKTYIDEILHETKTLTSDYFIREFQNYRNLPMSQFLMDRWILHASMHSFDPSLITTASYIEKRTFQIEDPENISDKLLQDLDLKFHYYNADMRSKINEKYHTTPVESFDFSNISDDQTLAMNNDLRDLQKERKKDIANMCSSEVIDAFIAKYSSDCISWLTNVT